MHIDKNGKRINVAGAIQHDGVTYNGNVLMFPVVVQALGITEVDEPQPPNDYDPELYFRSEIDDEPYVIYTRKSDEQIMAVLVRRYEQALDNHLDSVAQQYRYNNRFTFALRAGYTGPFQAEGVAFAQWMDSVNAQAYDLLLAVQAGQAVPPTVEEFIAGLPEFVKP